MKHVKSIVLTCVLVMSSFSLTQIGAAHADDSGCQTDLWGFLATQRRVICDSARRADGSWERARVVYTPAHQVPSRTSCYGSSYVTCTTTGGYFVPFSEQERDLYDVTDENVLPQEPGWLCCSNLPASTPTLR